MWTGSAHWSAVGGSPRPAPVAIAGRGMRDCARRRVRPPLNGVAAALWSLVATGRLNRGGRLEAALLRHRDRGGDVGEMGESLREIAQHLPVAGIILLGEEPEIVARR